MYFETKEFLGTLPASRNVTSMHEPKLDRYYVRTHFNLKDTFWGRGIVGIGYRFRTFWTYVAYYMILRIL